jgi:(R)-2-hydroxyacyl-CoA dehydratese activating ATPase
MNDRCAAGTGRFLEMVAERMEVELDQLGDLARRGGRPSAISSMCAVFAETEIIGLLAGGVSAPDIVAGAQRSIAVRIAALASRLVDGKVVLTVGVALVDGVDLALQEALGRPVSRAPDPQMTGALGAALLAARQLQAQATGSI